jgi:hypothetical protein
MSRPKTLNDSVRVSHSMAYDPLMMGKTQKTGNEDQDSDNG